MYLTSLPKQTPLAEPDRELSLGAVSLAHLIRSTSIISSSNPYKLTVQGEREAAPARVHRVRAICWATSSVTPRPRAVASQERLCVHPCPLGLPTVSTLHPTQAGRPTRRAALACTEAAATGNALLCVPGTQMPPFSLSLACSLTPRSPQQGASLEPREGSSTQTTPTRAGALPRSPEAAKKERPRNRGGDT